MYILYTLHVVVHLYYSLQCLMFNNIFLKYAYLYPVLYVFLNVVKQFLVHFFFFNSTRLFLFSNNLWCTSNCSRSIAPRHLWHICPNTPWHNRSNSWSLSSSPWYRTWLKKESLSKKQSVKKKQSLSKKESMSRKIKTSTYP